MEFLKFLVSKQAQGAPVTCRALEVDGPNLMRNQSEKISASFCDGISQEKGRPLVGPSPRGSCERRVRFRNPGFP